MGILHGDPPWDVCIQYDGEKTGIQSRNGETLTVVKTAAPERSSHTSMFFCRQARVTQASSSTNTADWQPRDSACARMVAALEVRATGQAKCLKRWS